MPFAIGIERAKTEENVGTLWRSAYNFGAAMIFTVGRRYRKQSSDVLKTWRHIPLLHFATWAEYRAHAPHDWEPIGVEITEEAKPLIEFTHPRCAVYLLGPEDGHLSQEARALTRRIVSIPSRYCLNVAVAGAVVMYDRVAKRGEKSIVRERRSTLRGERL
jgi:tRNA G18 (ribose-2'-O)-methylase SpoU